MPQIDPLAVEHIKSELMDGETIHWSQRPMPGVTFSPQDFFLIPFSFLWGGFALFWEASVLGLIDASQRISEAGLFFKLWGIPFVFVGQYLIWGRFVYATWKKRDTFYAVTNWRVIVVQEVWTRKVVSA